MRSYDQNSNDLSGAFFSALTEAMKVDLGHVAAPQVSQYLADLMVKFVHADAIFAIRDSLGRRVVSLTEMMAEGDVGQKADSFDRERVVHKHIGDLLLFSSGLYPGFLSKLSVVELDAITDFTAQGKASYELVSLFDHPPHDQDAPVYRELSRDFEILAVGLQWAGKRLSLC